MSNDLDIRNNEQQMQFEYREGDEIAKMQYRFYKDSIALMHTEVPDAMKGKGVASALAEFAFGHAKESNKRVMVYCPFVLTYVKRHPEVQGQLDKTYHK